ncbi:glycosyltransferase family 2 protein [Calidifontibacter terrae]
MLSIVVPMFNEEEVLPLFVDRIGPVLADLKVPYEVVAVDDGSSDQTPVLLQKYLRRWPELRVLRLRTNAGHQAAISAGLVAARGDWMVTIDSDLQDPPEVIADMWRAATTGDDVDVVYGVRSDRATDSRFKRTTARGFYLLMRRWSDVDAPMDAGDFRMMSRATVDAINALPEANRVLRLAVPTLGFPSTTVDYKRDPRAAGTSKYPLSKMLKLTFDALTGFSHAPLRLATWFSLAGFALATVMFIYAIAMKAFGQALPGWTSTVVIVSGFAAVQLFCIGLIGEYVGRIYLTQHARPSYYIAYDSADAAASSAAAPATNTAAKPAATSPRAD